MTGLLRVVAGIVWQRPDYDARAGPALVTHKEVRNSSLRHTFGSLLSKGGVAPRTAQAAMRHSKIDLTMNVYTDPALLDVRGALDTLPNLPLDPMREAERATGTAGDFRQGVYSLAPTLAPTQDKLGQTGATTD